MRMFSNNDPSILLNTDYDGNYCIGAGETVVLIFDNPKENGEVIIPQKYDLKYSISKSYHKSYAGGISTDYHILDDEVQVSATNNSGKKLYTVHVNIILFDGSGKVIKAEESYVDCKDIGSMDYKSFYFQKDATGEAIIPARCVVYVEDAYIYN